MKKPSVAFSPWLVSRPMRSRGSAIEQRYKKRLFGRYLEKSLDEKSDTISQNMLAIKLGRSSSTITGWKSGRTLPESEEDFEGLSKWLDADYDYMLELAQLDDIDYMLRKWGLTAEEALLRIGSLKAWEGRATEYFRDELAAARAVRPHDKDTWRALKKSFQDAGVPVEELVAIVREQWPDFEPPEDDNA